MPEEYERRVFREAGWPVNTGAVIERHWIMLKELAQEGNIAVVQQDMLNPQLLEIFAGLPEIKDSNNVIYLSNIADWIWRARDREVLRGESSFKKEDYAPFQNLHLLDTDADHKNYFADSLQNTLGYRVRISSFIPEYRAPQLQVGGHLLMDIPVTLPRDQIEGPISVTTNDLELRRIPLNELEEKYKNIIENPGYQRLSKVLNEVNKQIPGYDHETTAIRSTAAALWQINRAKEKVARGEKLSEIEEIYLEDEEFFTQGGNSKEEVEMAKIYLEVMWRIQAIDPQFNSTGKTVGEMIDILKSKLPPS